MPSDMNEHENIAKVLKARLSELTGRVAEIKYAGRCPLILKSRRPTSKIRTPLKPLKILKFKKFIKFEKR